MDKTHIAASELAALKQECEIQRKRAELAEGQVEKQTKLLDMLVFAESERGQEFELIPKVELEQLKARLKRWNDAYDKAWRDRVHGHDLWPTELEKCRGEG